MCLAVSGVRQNELYGYLWEGEEGALWCRVLTSTISGKMASVYFPDYGNTEEVKVTDLVELPREFYKLSFQVQMLILRSSNFYDL